MTSFLVSEEALKAATRLMIEKMRNLAEPAGAAALAAVLSAPSGSRAGRWRSSAAAATSARRN